MTAATLDRLRAPVVELRATHGPTAITVSGLAIVYGNPYVVVDAFGSFEETMATGVCSTVLASRCDTRFLINHEGLALARTVSGTLDLDEEVDGLRFVARLDPRQMLANDLVIAIERGDVSQMSCGFVVAPGGDEWSPDFSERTVTRFAELLDISAVTYPASPSTSIQLVS